MTVHVFEGEPMPDSEESFANIGKSKYFTGNIHAKRRHKNPTSFVTPDGFRFTVMPFGFIKRCCYVQSYDAGLVE